MIRRPMWLAAGTALGAGGTLWLEHRLRRRVQAWLPHEGDPLATVRQVGGRVRAAAEAGRTERARREAELWCQLGDVTGPVAANSEGTAPTRADPRRHAGRRHPNGRARRDHR